MTQGPENRTYEGLGFGDIGFRSWGLLRPRSKEVSGSGSGRVLSEVSC